MISGKWHCHFFHLCDLQPFKKAFIGTNFHDCQPFTVLFYIFSCLNINSPSNNAISNLYIEKLERRS